MSRDVDVMIVLDDSVVRSADKQGVIVMIAPVVAMNPIDLTLTGGLRAPTLKNWSKSANRACQTPHLRGVIVTIRITIADRT